eukprot:symbB.v1.2.032485.t1/scaffold3904.1/size48501/7
MVSALGSLKAPWEVSATQKFTPRQSHPPEPQRPFSVGRSRAQNMLNMALATQDDQAKVRRLDQALETPCVRYERAATPRLMQVAREATIVRRELTKKDRKNAWEETKEEEKPMAPAHPEKSAEELLKEEEAAALRIQSLYRGGKDRKAPGITPLPSPATALDDSPHQAVKAMAEQEARAATRIQSVYRGKATRREMASA